MNRLSSEERSVVYATALQFQDIFEKSKDLLVANATNPSEPNAYFALSNAIFIRSGGRYSLAATELNLNNERIVDAVFVLGRTAYIVELKNSVAQIRNKDYGEEPEERDNKSTRMVGEIVEQLDGIYYGSKFFERLENLHRVNRVVGVGVTIGNLRALESENGNLRKIGVTRQVAEKVGSEWIAASKANLTPAYDVILERTRISSISRGRETKSQRMQYEVGSAMLVFAKRFV